MPRAGNPEDRDYVYLFQVGLPEIKTGGKKPFFHPTECSVTVTEGMPQKRLAVKVQLSRALTFLSCRGYIPPYRANWRFVTITTLLTKVIPKRSSRNSPECRVTWTRRSSARKESVSSTPSYSSKVKSLGQCCPLVERRSSALLLTHNNYYSVRGVSEGGPEWGPPHRLGNLSTQSESFHNICDNK